MFDSMFNNFGSINTSNAMKINSCINNDYSDCTSLVNFDRHSKVIILQRFVLNWVIYVQKHPPLDEMKTELPIGCPQKTKCFRGCTNCCAKFKSLVRNAPKRLRKTEVSSPRVFRHMGGKVKTKHETLQSESDRSTSTPQLLPTWTKPTLDPKLSPWIIFR